MALYDCSDKVKSNETKYYYMYHGYRRVSGPDFISSGYDAKRARGISKREDRWIDRKRKKERFLISLERNLSTSEPS